MNYVSLPPGAALSIPADGIHAYLSGDIVECMARSNNVINTGFCPKADRDDTDLFVNSLTFEPKPKEESFLRMKDAKEPGLGSLGKSWVLDPPMGEFSVIGTDLPNAGDQELCRPINGPSVLVVTRGNGVMRSREGEGRSWDLKEGWVYFVGEGTEIGYEADGEGGNGLQVYRMFCE